MGGLGDIIRSIGGWILWDTRKKEKENNEEVL